MTPALTRRAQRFVRRNCNCNYKCNRSCNCNCNYSCTRCCGWGRCSVPRRHPNPNINPNPNRWGRHFVRRLEGEFAIVLVDLQRRRVIIAADVFGTSETQTTLGLGLSLGLRL